MNEVIQADVRLVQSISAVPTIMRVIADTTGLRFVCVARVTEESWTTCAVYDQLNFGLAPGDDLAVKTTICDEVRVNEATVVIDQVSTDEHYHDHPTPKMYGFESYFSIPIYRVNGEFFGTLCGLDPLPLPLSAPKVLDALKLYAELISRQLESEARVMASEAALSLERQDAELREQFIAVLGHDLRTPLSSIVSGATVLKKIAADAQVAAVAERIHRSGQRIAGLVDDVMDFARGRLGGGIPLAMQPCDDLAAQLRHAVAELESAYPQRRIDTDIVFDCAVHCDPKRVVQLVSNLMVNALAHGDPAQAVGVRARCDDGVLEIAVGNGGPPIPAPVLARLFQPFWRGSVAAGGGGAGGKAEGLGLGLYIAAQIARSHNGGLSVESTPARTVFTFTARPPR
ncbi:HAMP domain-containing sensor histidine kinase [Rugamonas sp.]|uniref:sensor histidine kinase n=1 Tax=Rugamonas sp. TaxID=1926287 RepID=UPI0025E1D74E|nr:HAMP domain-containing sensor histidine kinase [Rugamonas sp.]